MFGLLLAFLIAPFFVIQLIHLAIVLTWEDARTIGLNYYGLSPAGRDRFKRQLRLQAKLLSPVLWLNRHTTKFDFRRARIIYKGISAPSGSCSVESFAAAEGYTPCPEDIFVVTQMRCGTTWMQHLIFQILHRGNGDLVETGRTLSSVSPWIEGRRGVPVDQAPLLGTERPSRIIKTHLPVQLCPFSREARYIYVARDPASCFASCVDFIATNVGAMAPPLAKFEEWFTSEELMWWGTWPSHVKGWCKQAQNEPNILVIRFERMKEDLPRVAQLIAAFLQLQPLSTSELAKVVEKCEFAYMQKNQANFEMQPPHIWQTEARFFVSGSAKRSKDLLKDTQARIETWAADLSSSLSIDS